MNRCPSSDQDACSLAFPPQIDRRGALQRLLAGAGLVSLAVLAASAHAGMRTFPMDTRRGRIVFTNPPQVLLNDKSEQLSPGTRIHDAQNNRLVFATTLKGQKFVVNYVRDGTGTIREIWILTPEEIQEKLPPTQLELWQQQQQQLQSSQSGQTSQTSQTTDQTTHSN
jgi:hypothetical protein